MSLWWLNKGFNLFLSTSGSTFDQLDIRVNPSFLVKKFTLDAFQSIDVKEMLDAVEIPEDKSASFSLAMKADGRPLTYFLLNVAR